MTEQYVNSKICLMNRKKKKEEEEEERKHDAGFNENTESKPTLRQLQD